MTRPATVRKIRRMKRGGTQKKNGPQAVHILYLLMYDPLLVNLMFGILLEISDALEFPELSINRKQRHVY